MHNNASIGLFKKLSPGEIKLFGEFLRSPYLNSNKNLIRLYDIISTAAPKFNSRNLKKENLFGKIYPDKPFNEGSLRTRMSEFGDSIRKFLIYEEFRKDPNAGKDYLAAAYKRMDMQNESLGILDKSLIAAGEGSKFYSDYFDRMFKLFAERKMLIYTGGDYYKTLEGMYKMLDYNLYRFLPRFVSIKTEMTAFEKIYNVKKERSLSDLFFENFDAEKFITAMEHEKFKHHDVFRIYYDSMMALLHVEDRKYRDRVKNELFTMHGNFNKYELYNIWANLTLACNLAVDKDKNSVYKDYFEVTKFIIKKNVFPLHEDGYLLDSEYRNIVSAAVRVKEYDWAENFVEEFKSTLIPSVREQSYNIVKAKCRFYKNDFEGCINYLSRVNTNDVIINLDIKTFLFMSYFELSYFDQAESIIDSFRHYVTESKKMASLSKLEIPLFIKYASIIQKAKYSGNKIRYNIIREIEEDKWFTMKGWMQEKVKEFIE